MNMNALLNTKASMSLVNPYLFRKQMGKSIRRVTIFAKDDDDSNPPSVGSDTTRIIRPKKPTIKPGDKLQLDKNVKLDKNIELNKTIKIDKKQ